MKKILFMLLLTVAIGAASARPCVMYFWQVGCHNCELMEPYLEDFESQYSAEIYRFEMRYNDSNRHLFYDTLTSYNLSTTRVYTTPVVFVGEVLVEGFRPVEVESAIAANPDACCSWGHAGSCEFSWLSQITVPTVVAAALVDSINPCAFAVMIFLLTYIMSIGAKRRVLKVGMAYVTMVFLTYLLAGIGILQVVQLAGVSSAVYIIAAVLAIAAGAVNVKDYFWYGKGLTLKIPESRKKTIQKYVKRASLPAAFVLGFLVALFELPCTGGIYLAILGLLSNSMTYAAALPYLILYNFIFIVPLIVILALVYSGSPAGDMEKWRESRKRQMKLASGLFMLALGLIMLLGLI